MLGDTDLYESLDESLCSMGEKLRNLVISVFEAKGISFRPENLDAKAVDEVLFELFGMGSEAIIISAYNRLDRKLMIGFDDSRIADPVQKIRKWLEISSKEQTVV